MLASQSNRVLLPPNSVVGSCGTRWLCGGLSCDSVPEPERHCCDTFPIMEAIHEIVFEAENIPLSVAQYYFLTAAREFMIDSKVLKRDEEFYAECGDREFCLQPCDHEEVGGIEALLIDGCCADDGTYQNCATRGSYRKQGRGLVTAYPMDREALVRVSYYALPTLDACELDVGLKPYIPAITDLAMARLMTMPGKPWRDLNGAAMKRQSYAYHLGQAKLMAEFSGGNTQVSTDGRTDCCCSSC